MRKLKMSMLNLVSFFLVLNRIESIYVAEDNGTNTATLNRAGIKTLSWQGVHQPQNVTFHHNYSRVYTHQTNQPIYNYSLVTRTYTQTGNARRPQYNFTSVSRIPKNNVYTVQNAHLYQLSPNLTDTSQISINDHSGGFNSHLIVRNSTTETFGQRPVINDHLSREFSGNFAQAKPQRLTLNLHVTPQHSRYNAEKIENFKECPKDATGQFVYELSCNQFLNCWKGKGYVQNCPPGTLFNPKTSECDFNYKVRCITGPREIALKEREPLTAAIQAKCPAGFTGIIPHYTDCSKFINCHNGAEFVMACAPGTLFDIKSNNCDYPHRALCVGTDNLAHKHPAEFGQQSRGNQTVSVQAYNTNVTYELRPQNQRIIMNNQLGDFENSQSGRDARFYSGNTGFRTNNLHQSTNRAVYSTNTQENQWNRLNPVYIGRESEISNVNEQNAEPKTDVTPKCPAGTSGLFPHPTICEKFLNCVNGQTFIQDCGPGTVFNPKFKVCDYPYNVDCHAQSPGDIYTTNRPDELNRNYRMIAGLNEAYSMGLSKDFCSSRKGYSIYPDNCSRFIYCDDSGDIFIGICPENMYYDPSSGICQENIDCQALANQFGKVENWQVNQQYDKFRLVEIGGEIYSLGLTSTYCQNNLGFSKHPINCNKFLLCTDDGQLLLGVCNANTFFDPSKRTCDHSYRCGQQNHGGSYQVGQRFERFRLESIQNELNQLGLDNTNGKFCQLNPGFSPYSLNCSKFFVCTNDWRLLLGVCNPNMFFVAIRKICDYNSNCLHVQGSEHDLGQTAQNGYELNVQYERFRTADITGELEILRLNRIDYCQNHLGFSPHPYDCTKFLLCNTNGELLLGICNPNTFYDPTTGACTTIANCAHIQRENHVENQQNFRLVEGGSEMNVLGLDMNFCGSNNGFLSHPKNCSRFLLCQNGKFMLGICHEGWYYNPNSRMCDNNYKCGGIGRFQWENQQFGIHSDNAEISGLNLEHDYCNNHEGFSIYPRDIAKFLFCKYGRLYIGVCKSGLVYNQNIKTCVSVINTPEVNQEEIQPNLDCQTKAPGLHPHPTDCSKFINCANGVGKIHDCAAGTAFNPVSKVCDFPHNVDCSRSGIRDNSGHSNQNQNVEWAQQNQNNFQGTYDQNLNNRWGDSYDQDQNNQWVDQYDQKNQGDANENRFDDQSRGFDQQNSNQWGDADQNNRWSEDQDQNNWLATTPSTLASSEATVLTYDQNKKPSTRWPPAFPSTDPNADYVFEANDLVEAVVPNNVYKEDCTETDFHCTKDTCIDPIKVCDGNSDCPDGEDEKNCEGYIEQFSHLSSTKMAVREKVRYNNVTLALCAKYCVDSKNFTCKAFNFRNMDGTCFLLTTNVGLSGSLFILPTYDYFEYKKHSIDCSQKLKCPNQKCIEEKQVCDGINDCFDLYDEKGCTAVELGYSIRLIGSEKSYEGALQVTALGKTGLVCDDMFSMEAANIVCKELGFDLGAAEIKKNSYFLQHLNPNHTTFIMDDVICTGNEFSIRDCDFSGWGVSNCMEREAVGVVCKIPTDLCAHDMWKCQTVNECVPLTFICDGVNDCSDNSDEASQFCEAPNEMRLADGKNPGEGRVEIKHHGTWGTICDDDFNEDAGKVVCRFLGYNGPARVKKEAYFGAGEGPIWLDQVFCQGNESSLEDCIRWDWGVHNCEHNEDVGLICDDYANEGSPRNLALDEETPQPALPEGRCGYRNDDIFLENDEVHFRVVKGAVAQKGHYPWQASIKVKGRSKPSHWCGAVVISSKFVLTAAHCLYGFTKGAYVVVAGDYDVNEDEGTEQQAYIEEFYIHEHFRKITKMNNDVALVRLKGNGFNITRDIQPICLPPADFSNEVGMNCTISGFGSVHSGRAVASKELRAGWIPIQPAEICKMPHVYGKSITDGMFCAGPLDGGIDACDGDSGGPLACLHEGYFTLIGMTSWGQHCGEANKPGVYVKIAHYRNWIDDMMRKHA